MCVARSILLKIINDIPIIDPKNEERIIVNKVFSMPIQKPIIAIIFTSPMPMPSCFLIIKNSLAVTQNIPPAKRPLKTLLFREISIIGSVGADRSHIGKVMKMISEGVIHPVIGDTMPFQNISEAYKALSSNSVPGRIVLTLQKLN